MKKIILALLVIGMIIFGVSCTNSYPVGYYAYGNDEPVILKITTGSGSELYEIPANTTKSIELRRGSIISAAVVKSTEEPNMIDNYYSVSLGNESIKISEKALKQIPVKSFLPDNISVEGVYIAESHGNIGRYKEEGTYNRISLSDLSKPIDVYGSINTFILENEDGTQITTIDEYPVNIKIVDGVLIVF